jgi:hypothetical protein
MACPKQINDGRPKVVLLFSAKSFKLETCSKMAQGMISWAAGSSVALARVQSAAPWSTTI